LSVHFLALVTLSAFTLNVILIPSL